MKPTTVKPPDFSIASVSATVAEKYHLSGKYTQLVSERDQNFRLASPDGREFVVKVTGLLEEPVATQFQIAALLHFEKNGFDYAPRVFRAISGAASSTISDDDGQEYSLRVVTWLNGRLLKDVGLSEQVSARFGQRLAELDFSLKSLDFDGDGQAGLWDMQDAQQLQSLLHHINHEKTQEYARDVLVRFQDHVLPRLQALPSQAIHNDANPENILIGDDGEVSGFIDFGDSVKAPRIIDVAIAASYLREHGENPLKYIKAFVDGYHRQNPLSDTEFDLLFDLIRTRLATTVTLMYWRLSARDENDPYRQKTLQTESNAFDFLVVLSDLGREAFDLRIKGDRAN
jgi:Ser/Thr protein kinase RdoA (MazF antagonist)